MTSDLKAGDLVQIDPEHDACFGGCFMVVTEPKSWGAQGYISIPSDNKNEKPGAAYYRCPHKMMHLIGRAEWVLDRGETR